MNIIAAIIIGVCIIVGVIFYALGSMKERDAQSENVLGHYSTRAGMRADALLLTRIGFWFCFSGSSVGLLLSILS